MFSYSQGRFSVGKFLVPLSFVTAMVVIGLGPVAGKPASEKKSAHPARFGLTVDQEKKVDRAIARGLAYLKKTVLEDTGKPIQPDVDKPTQTIPVTYPGAMCLAGLTLVGCGVAADDPAVKKAVDQVRSTFPYWSSAIDTYDLSVALLFLDQLNQPRDRGLIQAIALRLVAAQNAQGGWWYTSPVVLPSTTRPLWEALKKPGPPGPEAPALLKKFPALLIEPGKKIVLGQGYYDHSISQFVVLALWAARKHGIPSERPLILAAEHFRSTQNEDGSWGYRNKGGKDWTFFDSMTCAGLLTLAVARGAEGASAPRRALRQDPVIQKALKYAGQSIGKKALPLRSPTPQVYWGAYHGGILGANAWDDLYYLWTLERMALIYNLREIAGKKWYPWGADLIVAVQQPDGSWKDRLQGPVDTCFALLFLKRVNVAPDLTRRLNLENIIEKKSPQK